MRVGITGAVGYILKGYPRRSETFIANEIHLLESMGLSLRLYSIAWADEGPAHSVVALIQAPVSYLPPVTSLSGTSYPLWLWRNLPKFAVVHLRLAARRPRLYLETLGAVFAMSWRYRRAPLAAPRKELYRDFLQAGAIAMETLKDADVRHLHAPYCDDAATVTWFAARLTGLPFSFAAHARDIYNADGNPGDLLARKMRAARFVTTCTSANRAHLAELCPEQEALHTIYQGIDITFFAPCSPPPGGLPLILGVGSLVEMNGFDYLVAACAQLKAAGVSAHCALVGTRGPHSNQITSLIERLGVGDVVTMHGTVTQELLREVYRRATLVVLPRLKVEDRDQGDIPNVLAEAMATGVPVVSTRISVILELIEHGRNGVLVPERDSSALARAMRALLESPGLGRRLGEAGRRKICACFDSRRTTSQVYKLLADSLGADAVAAPLAQPAAAPAPGPAAVHGALPAPGPFASHGEAVP